MAASSAEKIGGVVRAIRLACGLGQKQFGHLVGVPMPRLSAIERGKYRADVAVLLRVGTYATGADREWLIEYLRGALRGEAAIAVEALAPVMKEVLHVAA